MTTKIDVSKFGKHHFNVLAKIIQTMPKVHDQTHYYIDIREDVAEYLATKFKSNPEFDRVRFLDDCLKG